MRASGLDMEINSLPFVVLSEAKDLLFCRTKRKQVLRFAQDDNSIFSPVLSLLIRELIIKDSLGVQLLDKAGRVGANFPGRREDELLLEFLYDLLQRQLAGA